MKLSTIAIASTTVLSIFAQYEDICDKNQQYCVVTCDKQEGVKVNICSPKDLNFDCVCGNNKRPIDEYGNFPAKTEGCNEQLKDCNESCKDDDPCLQECSKKYVCIFKDVHDGNTTKPTTSTTAAADKSKASTVPSGPPKLNNSSTLANAPAYTFVAGTLFALALYL